MLGQALSLLRQEKTTAALRTFAKTIKISVPGTPRVSDADLYEFCSGVLAIPGHLAVCGGELC